MRYVLSLVVAVLGAPVVADPLVIFAAASLKQPVDQLVEMHGDAVVSYGGSGALARQVMRGAPADVVLLAHPVWMEELTGAGRVDPEQVREVASNRLVLIGPTDAAPLDLNAAALMARLDGGRLAMGFTQAVPAGQYGRAALEALGIWDAVAGQVAEVDNVRAALVLVARGEVPLGIVYATDAGASDAVRVVAHFPSDSHPAIRYVAAPVGGSEAGAAFLDLIGGDAGQAAFAAAGFAK